MILRWTVVFVFCCTLGFGLAAQNCDGTRYIDPIFSNVIETPDVKYGEARAYGALFDQDLRLDIYEPDGDTLSKRPVIVFMYGGAFLIGTRNQPPIPDYARYFAERGYVVVSIQYRIGFNTVSGASAERAVYRAIQDLDAALRYLAQRRFGYRIDMSNIITTGTSAGSIAGLHHMFLEESDRPTSTYGILLEPSDLGCFSCSGNTDFGSQPVFAKAHINHWGAILDTAYIDANENHPVLHFHGTGDAIVQYGAGAPFNLPIWPTMMGSELIHKRMQNLGHTTQHNPWYGIGHEPELLDANYLDTMKWEGRDWLYSIMRPELAPISGSNSICQYETVTYSVPADNSSWFCWDVVGGTIISENNHEITIQWNAAGNYSLAVTEEACNLYVSEQQSLNVTVYPEAVAAFAWDSTYLEVDFVNGSSSNATSYQWSFGDGSSSTMMNPSHTYAGTGNYTVELISTTADGCSDTITQVISVQAQVVSTQAAQTLGGVTVRPTIVSDVVLIDVVEQFTGSVDVFDIYGQLIERKELTQVNQLHINAHEWSTGMYILVLRAADGRSFHQQVVKTQ